MVVYVINAVVRLPTWISRCRAYRMGKLSNVKLVLATELIVYLLLYDID